MIELSRTQDEEVGDGTTSVIVLGTENILFLVSNSVSIAWLGRVFLRLPISYGNSVRCCSVF